MVIRYLRSSLATIIVALIAPAIAPALAQQQPPGATIAWAVANSAPQLPIATQGDLWKAAGVDMKSVTFASGPLAFEALIGGQVDFMTTAELPSVTAAMKNQAFTIIADLSRFHGNRFIANFPLKSVADLNGKKIGVTLGTSSQFLLETELQRAGVKAEIVNVAPSDVVAALLRNDISAAMPFLDAIPQAKKVLGDKYHELPFPSPTHFVLIATREVVMKRPQVVKSVLTAMLAADKIIAGDPAKAQESVSRAMNGFISADQLKATWPDYDFATILDERLLDLMTLEGQWIAAGGMIKNVTPTKTLFRSFISEAPLKGLAPSRVTLR